MSQMPDITGAGCKLDSTPFADAWEMLREVLRFIALNHTHLERDDFANHLAWLLFVTPVSYIYFLSPVSDYIDQHDAGLWFGLGAFALSCIWRAMMQRVIHAWDAERLDRLVLALAGQQRLDIQPQLEQELRTFDYYFPQGQTRIARPDYSRREHVRTVSESVIQSALIQTSQQAHYSLWERQRRLRALVAGRAATWISIIVYVILCIAADTANNIWPWLAAQVLVWVLLLPLWSSNIAEKAFYYSLVRTLSQQEELSGAWPPLRHPFPL